MTFRDISVLAHLVGAQYDTNPDKEILTFVDEWAGDVETRTYRELYENAHKLAAFLTEKGMKRGDRFALLLKNHPEVPEALIAASITGCLAVPVDPRTKGDKLAYMLNDAGCRGLIHANYNADEVNTVLGQTGVEWALEIGEGYAEVAGRPYEEQPIVCTSGTDPLQVLYTSGTTGDPKGIVKENGQLGQVATALPMIMKLQRSDKLYTGLSLSHGNAQMFTLAVALGAGYPAVFSRSFTKSWMWDTIRKYGCNTFTLLGGMSNALYSEPPKPDDADNPVRVVLCAGMPAAIWEPFKKRFGVELFEVYGAAEGGLFWNDGSGPVGSCGNILTNPLFAGRVVNENDEDCAPGEQGELIWQNKDGKPVSVEYLNKPEASAKKIAGGWFRTGDIVHKDENGWIFFDYRKGGGIRRNGDFINPGFVEKALAENDQVEDVFVYGIPSANGTPGEKDVVAAIVVKDAAAFDAGSVFADCRQKLESNFVPSYLQVVDVIPKTASEKPQERFLIEMFAKDAPNVHTQAGG